MLLTRRNSFSFDPFRDFVDAMARDAAVAAAGDCCSTDASASCCGGAKPAAAEVGFPMDISEVGGTLVVRGSLPGFRKEDVSVHVRNGVLTIEASRAEEVVRSAPEGAPAGSNVAEPTERFYRRERFEGAVVRRLRLPQRFADTEPTAELRDGVLTLRFPESPAAKPRQVVVR